MERCNLKEECSIWRRDFDHWLLPFERIHMHDSFVYYKNNQFREDLGFLLTFQTYRYENAFLVKS